jgi:hypothetical protein
VDLVSPYEKNTLQSISQVVDSTKSIARSDENSQVSNTGGTSVRLSARSQDVPSTVSAKPSDIGYSMATRYHGILT